MNSSGSIKDKYKKSNMSQPNYRFLPALRSTIPFPHLPQLTPMPHPPLLAMQLMMLRMRNSSPYLNETQHSYPRSYFSSGMLLFVFRESHSI